MSGVRLEVQWSPVHPDKCITWGTEIFLYEVVSLKDVSKLSCMTEILFFPVTVMTSGYWKMTLMQSLFSPRFKGIRYDSRELVGNKLKSSLC
jgi:hypothetical protein